MYLKQTIFALIAGTVTAIFASSAGIGLLPTIASGVLVYLLIRWSVATIARIRYWKSRSSEILYTNHCPNCNRDRYRLAGDWILKCHKCGWKPGPPILRWFTRSVPGIQFQRSISKSGAFIAGACIGVVSQIYPESNTVFIRSATLPAISNFSIPWIDIVYGILGLGVILLGLIIFIMYEPKTYCMNCGQYLGRGKPDGSCNKCGSNRFTHDDPGVGEKVRVEFENK